MIHTLLYIVQGVNILFNPMLSYFLAKSYFVLFFGKCSILSYFLAILPLILVDSIYSLFITIISCKNIWHQNSFCWDPFFTLFIAWHPPVKYINVRENKLFSWEKSYFCPIFWRKILFFPIFWGCNVLFFTFLTCPITWHPDSNPYWILAIFLTFH